MVDRAFMEKRDKINASNLWIIFGTLVAWLEVGFASQHVGLLNIKMYTLNSTAL